ncbi:hypothetical protein CXG81DRAFT_14886 [Caulochytrium protostelioides]|uniref:ATP synthase subunit d, mitochondrial n=1 Tax=Caulochytrium protostelioides TaxID=1555241 RepID=A0A4P9X0A9_9FUNG|nr:hypothetical protein CXG81DRAFT_14886 [Caulochytrium protostelioides]|eukprot:RKO99171.1 hypothetical protein CXG81DRAFT_14886 [Caulochytrium protostelioides]
MSAVKSAATRIDWTGLAAKLRPETTAAVGAFRRRHADLLKRVDDLKAKDAAGIDFAAYRAQLKQNAGVVAAAEKSFKAFKPATIDLAEQLKVIDAEEKKAVAAAKQTAAQVHTELTEMKQMLQDIESARPVDQLTVDDIAKAYPELVPTAEKMVKRGQWVVPGYQAKFGDFALGF